MKFFNETFEYLVHNLPNPSNKDLVKYTYDDKEYKILEWHKLHFETMLTALGSRGWKLITKSDNSYDNKTIAQLIFKRSSRSKYYQTGLGVDVNRISNSTKEQAEANHIS